MDRVERRLPRWHQECWRGLGVVGACAAPERASRGWAAEKAVEKGSSCGATCEVLSLSGRHDRASGPAATEPSRQISAKCRGSAWGPCAPSSSFARRQVSSYVTSSPARPHTLSFQSICGAPASRREATRTDLLPPESHTSHFSRRSPFFACSIQCVGKCYFALL